MERDDNDIEFDFVKMTRGERGRGESEPKFLSLRHRYHYHLEVTKAIKNSKRLIPSRSMLYEEQCHGKHRHP